MVNQIIRKEELAPNIKLFEIDQPLIARKVQPGQFVVVRHNEKGERIPLTVADYDSDHGTITIIFQEVGKSTYEMGELTVGDTLLDVVGPLGQPSEIANYGTVVCIGGGVGIAPVYPITRALKDAGNRTIAIIGARTKELLFWEERSAPLS